MPFGNDDYVEFGPHVPYPQPVGYPVDDIGADPLWTICVNRLWLPYVNGAVKSLLADETWRSSDPSVLTDLTDQVNRFIAGWRPTTTAECQGTRDWFFTYDFNLGSVVYSQDLTDPSNSFNFGGWMAQVFVARMDFAEEELLVRLWFRDQVGWVGPTCEQIWMATALPLDLLMLTVQPCGGLPVGIVTSGNWRLTDNFPAGTSIQYIDVSSTSALVSVAIIAHPPLVCAQV